MEPTTFHSLTELTNYLAAQDKRIRDLESANGKLISIIENHCVKRNEIIPLIESAQPTTGLVSRNFLTSAFTVWGHWFVAQLIIGLTMVFISVVITLGLLWVSHF
jgi:hypothetical protein